jgi:heme/copper-type cytochrome/quinol oxidase subunit 2
VAVTATGAAAGDAATAAAVAAATAGIGATEVSRLRSAGAALLAVLTASSALPAGPSVDVKVSRGGFEPSRIVLRRGETARLVLQSVDGEHCFAVDGLRIEKRVVKGRATRLELTPERTGSFPFHCCLEIGAQADRERGEIVVSE